jgi:hypothetical protein
VGHVTVVRTLDPSGSVRIDGDDLLIGTDFVKGHLSHTAASEQRIAIAEIETVLLAVDSQSPAMAVQTSDQVIGWHVQRGSESDPSGELSKEMATLNHSLDARYVAELPDSVQWLKAGAKMGFKASVSHDAQRLREQPRRDGDASQTTPEVEVKVYKTAKDYEKDAPKMYRDGWHVEGQSARTKKWSMTTGFFTNKQITTITWVRSGGMTMSQNTPSREVKIEQYKSPRKYKRGVEQMYREGWSIGGETSRRKRWSWMTGILTRKQVITVTWVRLKRHGHHFRVATHA